MKLSAATRLEIGKRTAAFLCLLMISLAHSFSADAQTRSQLQQNNAPGYNYQSGAFRRLFYVPEDTLATTDSGALAYRNGSLWLKRHNYWTPIGAGLNFANADLTLTGNRNHFFGSNSMRFNFTGLGLNGDGFVGFNEGSTPGITIQGDGSYLGPTIVFKDLAQPAAPGIISSYAGELRLDGQFSTVKGFGRFGPDSTIIGVDFSGKSKSISLWNVQPGKFGITIRDTQDMAGMHYQHNYRDSGLAKFGDRWIPDVGGIKNLLPDDFSYLTEESGCVDTSFTGTGGLFFNRYEKKTLPQFIGFRIRVYGGDIWPLIPYDDGATGVYYTWNKATGELRIYYNYSGPCELQKRIVQAY